MILCTATGIPTPTYTWSRNNEPIVNNMRMSYDNSTGVLVIQGVTKQDAGMLRCDALNALGRDQRVSRLDVLGNQKNSYRKYHLAKIPSTENTF